MHFEMPAGKLPFRGRCRPRVSRVVLIFSCFWNEKAVFLSKWFPKSPNYCFLAQIRFTFGVACAILLLRNSPKGGSGMWYTNSYRRHLCDMHIEDWDESFLSRFDPEVYYQNLKRADVDAAMIYLHSHVGLCNFPTKEGRMHRAFAGRENALAEMIAKCRQNGIRVVGYYSLTHDNEAYDSHPDWRMLTEQGVGKRGGVSPTTGKPNRYGLVCPNNEEYRAFTLRRIDEMAAYAEMDGMFYDMPFWPHYCHCPQCEARFLAETGERIPTGAFAPTPLWLAFLRCQKVWMAEFIQLVTDYTKQAMPGVSVEHNVAYAALPSYDKGMSMELLRACDYAGGDLYGTAYEQSFTCKYYYATTTNQPFEYMFSRCTPGLSKHTLTKSEDRCLSAVMLTCANHGATLVIDAIDPVGTMDSRVYERIGRAFAVEKRYEPFLRGKACADVGLYYSFHSRYPDNGNKYTNPLCVPRLARKLIENHVPHGIVGGEFGRFADYKVVVASCLTDEEGEGIDKLLDYVREGGNLIFSDGRCKRLMRELLGNDATVLSGSCNTYVAPTAASGGVMGEFNADFPLAIDGFVPLLQGSYNGEALATVTLPYTDTFEHRFASIHSNPPGKRTPFPAIVQGNYGKGKFIWLSHVPEFEQEYEYGRLMLRLLRRLMEKGFSVSTDAPADVEILTFLDGKEYLVSAAQLSDDYCARAVAPFSVSLRADRPVRAVTRLPDDTPVPFEQEKGSVTFRVDNFRIFDMFRIRTE